MRAARAPLPALAAAALACLLPAGARPAAAQAPDIEAVAGMRGIELPAAHFEMLRQQPDLYTFERALFRRVAPWRTPTEGEVRLPVVLILFGDSPEPHVSVQDVQNALFDDSPVRGTITEAYLEMSRGALTVDGDVFGWARSTIPMDSVVGSNWGLGSDNRAGEYFVQGLDELDPLTDFTQYDSDGPDGLPNSGDDDGFVDVITFEYLEVSASCGGPAIWPHRSRLSFRAGAAYVTDDIGINGDTIRIQDYITQGATDCAGENVQDAGVITHEFGHALGLPDWYHWIDSSIGPFGRRWVLGCWALMAAGSWGCGPVEETRAPFGPTGMIGFSRDYLGWIDFADPGEVWNDTIELGPVRTTGEALLIPLDDVGREYLMAEFRDTGGFDRDLPAPGVLLYKRDTTVAIGFKPDPASDDPYPLTMIERDDNRSLLLMAAEGGSRGEPGDAWGVDGATHTLTATTTPALRLADGSWPPVQVHEVTVDGGVARLVLSTGRTPRLVEPTEPAEVMRIRTFAASVRVAGGYGPYEGVGTLPEGFFFGSEGDRLLVLGSMREPGQQTFTFAARDRMGSVSEEVSLTVSASIPWEVTLEGLLERFLASTGEGLTGHEEAYLDEIGNANGRYDVGDLRKWLRDNR